MFCNKCGNKLKEGDLFCNKCGNKTESSMDNFAENPQTVKTEQERNIIETKENIKQNKKSHKKAISIGIIIFSLIAVFSITTVIIYFLKNHNDYGTLKKDEKLNTNIEKENNEMEEHYLNILANKTKFKFEQQEGNIEDTNFSEILLKDEEGLNKIYYCICDIDNDNYYEMYVENRTYLAYYGDDYTSQIFIFNEEDNVIYGFKVNQREMEELKSDGTFATSGGTGQRHL